MNNEKNKTKQTKQTKDKRPEKEVVGDFLKIYQEQGQGDLFCLRKIHNNCFCLSRWAFYPKECRRDFTLLSRRQCARLLLSLQHQLGRKSLGIRKEVRRGKSGRTLRPKTKINQGRRKLVSRKNKTLRNNIKNGEKIRWQKSQKTA